jgi:hypothetical protein
MKVANHRRVLILGLVLFAGLAPLAALVLAPESATGTASLMTRLPAYQKFKCLLCHTSAAPVAGSSELNAFGSDFKANGMVWNETLALLNSDNDRCLNGFELGDENGDGTLDASGPAVERSNPADGSDCSIAVTFQTWGKIKAVFRSELPNYFDEETLYRYRLYGDGDDVHLP